LFFYAPGTTEWDLNSSGYFTHETNNYAGKGYFYLTEGPEAVKEIESYAEITQTPTHTISSFDEFAFLEEEKYNLLESGKQWFGDLFYAASTKEYLFPLTDPVESESASLLINAAARSDLSSSLKVTAGESALGSVYFSSVDKDDSYGLYADESNARFSFAVSGDELALELYYGAYESNAEAWLDYLELNYRRELKLKDEPVFFRDAASVGAGNILAFSIANGNADAKIMDVTSFYAPQEVPFEISNGSMVAQRPSDELCEYVVFSPSGDFKEPELVSEVENQNLHGLSTPELLIISHSNFWASAEDLASFHEEYDGMDVATVRVDKVYNEFSSGTESPTGIRNFIKMFYDRGDGLKYVLLLGDGSYDNKGIDADRNRFIPTFQSDNSLTPTSSFVTDDYFVLLDDGESVSSGAIDLGIGRIPATTSYEAQLVVDKIRNYYEPDALGAWRNVVTFIADDEDTGIHMRQSEQLADTVNKNNPEFITDKIYFDSYVEESSPSGDSYPDVNTAIGERVEDGVLLLNYIGHANERYLAHENVLGISEINAWSNASMLPIFVTATCEFSRFDGDDTSAGEYVLMNADGGGVGLFSTTRVVYSYANFELSKSFYNYIFAKDANGDHYRMGDVMRLAKVNIGTSLNKRNFLLLADPALRLSVPKYNVLTSAVNGQSADSSRQTLGALQEVTISGFVADGAGNKMTDFNGTLIPTVYDKAIEQETLGNGGQSTFTFNVRENIIYKGEAEVSNGEFSFSFVVPKDISYNIGEGKIVYYADNGEEDAHGAFSNFDIGGSGSSISDNSGPEIELFLDSPSFQSGDVVGKNPELLATLSDENGINTVGTGVGHDITAVLDNDYSNVIVLNNYYQANADDYTSGSISYPMSGLEEGWHTLTLKAWDVANNSSEVSIEFEVTGDLILSNVSNYPNPCSDYTYFVIEHNQSGTSLDVIVDIYDMSGRSIDRFQTSVGSSGFTTNPIRWDLSESGIAATAGTYIYRVIVQDSDGVMASKSGKMTIAP